MFMVLLSVVRVTYRNQTAHIVSLRHSEGFHYAGSVESSQIHGSFSLLPTSNLTPTLALSQHYELLHKESGVLVSPTLNRVRLALIASSSEGFLHAGEEGFFLEEHRN